jgi:lysophospholipase L1-like esterase
MRNKIKTGIAICVAFTLLYGCASVNKRSLEDHDKIVFLGDSITQEGVRPDGYITLTSKVLEKTYPDLNIEVIGAGLGGHKVTNCQKRLDRDVLQKKPTIVLIYIGINDVWWWNGRWGKGTTKDEFESGLYDLIKRSNAAGARVILCTPTVIGEKTDGTNEFDKMLDEYSDISRKVARDTESQLLDLRKSFMTYLRKHNINNVDKGILTRDMVHLNQKGNQFLSGLVLDALNVKNND